MRLTDTQVQELMSVDLNQVDTLKELLANHYDTKTKKVVPPKMPPNATFLLKKGTLFNEKDIETTVGRYIFNKTVLREKILSMIGYFNEVITNDVYEKNLDRQISILCLQDKLTSQEFVEYVTRLENFTFQVGNSLLNSFTEKVLYPNEKVLKRKEELIKKHKAELDAGDIMVATKIEKELVDMAREELKGDPGMDAYDSGVRGSFESNYKEANIMKGPIYNDRTGEFDIVTNSFKEGLAKKDLPAHGNSIASGAYPKAIGTAEAGHRSKQIIASLETVILDSDPHSFCGTQITLPIVIEKKIQEQFIGRTIKEGSKKVELTYDNIHKYVDKKVQLFSAIFCTRVNGGKICGVCGDKRALSLNVDKIGVASSRASASLLQLKMKKFHNATIKTKKLTSSDLFF